MSVNKVLLIGNVGKDPEVKHLGSGLVTASFSLATSETFTKNGEKITNTEWHNIVVWNKLAEIVEKYVKKGQTLYCEGKLQTKSFEGKDGVKKYRTEIVVDSLKMLGGKKEESKSDPQPDPQPELETTIYNPIDDSSNDLPF